MPSTTANLHRRFRQRSIRRILLPQ